MTTEGVGKRARESVDDVSFRHTPLLYWAQCAAAEEHQAHHAKGEERRGESQGPVAAIYETNFRIVKKAREADLNVFVDKDAEQGIAIVKDVRDSSSYYPFTAKGCINEVRKRLKRARITIKWKGEDVTFNKFHFDLFVRVFSMKSNAKFAYDRKAKNEKASSWIYSQQAIDFIVRYLTKDPMNCLDQLRLKTTEKI